VKKINWQWLVLLMMTACNSAITPAQSVPPSPDRPLHLAADPHVQEELKSLQVSRLAIDLEKVYSLPDLVDFAERNNPDTRLAWNAARARAAALHIAQSELYPTLSAIALSQVQRDDLLSGSIFVRQTVSAFGPGLQLDYTLFDFGARAGRIATARAELGAANFAFNDTHRKIIFQVADTYYRLLNSIGQVEAAEASLQNAETVLEAAEERLDHGLATLPDVLEARSASAQAEYDVQSARGIEEIARGDLATVLGLAPTVRIHVRALDQLPAPEIYNNSIEQLLDRAMQQRPDLLQQVEGVRAAEGTIREERAAYYPTLKLGTAVTAPFQYGWQQQFPAAHMTGLTGEATIQLDWTILDGGTRKNNLVKAKENRKVAVAKVEVTMDQVADEVWRSYSNLKTVLRQQQAATALLEAASQSYGAAVEAYGYGVRNLLDVTAAQRTLAQARSSDVAARTGVLDALADLAFRTGDLLRMAGSKDRK
jgi:outer membrane protein